jgi:hypothetical protein
LQQWLDQAVILFEQRGEEMFAVNLLVGMFLRDPLGGLERSLRFGGKSFRLHKI